MDYQTFKDSFVLYGLSNLQRLIRIVWTISLTFSVLLCSFNVCMFHCRLLSLFLFLFYCSFFLLFIRMCSMIVLIQPHSNKRFYEQGTGANIMFCPGTFQGGQF